jgi:ubiquinone/menaquinone biosynthesis C-methylase UbiE
MHKPQTVGRAPETKGRTIRWASHYDTFTWLVSLGKEPAIREMTLDLAGIAPGDKVLDVGCGTGTLTIAAKERAGASGEAYGIDAAPEMIEVARHKTRQKGVDADFQVGLIEDIPFPDDKFDLVLSSLMLHHLPEDLKHKGSVEIRRVLKPGGRLLAVDLEWSAHHLFAGLAALFSGQGKVQSNLQSLIPMMEEAGITAVESERTHYRIISFLKGIAG